jgi:hypothetical protein
MTMRHLILAAGLALACDSTTDPTLSPDFAAGIGEPIQLHVGQAVELDGRVTIGFSAVVADSRCPMSVTCVWAGDGAVELMIRHAGTMVVDTLHTLLDPTSVTVGDIAIQLTELAPYPEVPGTIPQSEYVVTLTTTAIR